MGKRTLSCIAILLSGLMAQGQEGLRQERTLSTFGVGINAVSQGHATTNRNDIFYDLLGNTDSGPGFPPFPRLWHEQYQKQEVSSNTYWKPSIKILSGGLEIDFKYAMKTTLVLVTSLEGATQMTNNGERIINAEAFQVMELNPTTRRMYPKVRKDVPMVAFCSYEVSFAMEKARSLGLEAMGFGTKITSKSIRGMSQTVYSKFFQISGQESIESLFIGHCQNTFQKKVKEAVERNFVPMVVEQTLRHHPNNQCSPSAISSPDGDYDCLEWFNKFDLLRKHANVPRCVTVKAGFNVCRLKAKRGMKCPLYRDKNGKIYDRVTQTGLIGLTQRRNSAPCDKGLKCTMDTQPRYLPFGNAPIIMGKATCKSL